MDRVPFDRKGTEICYQAYYEGKWEIGVLWERPFEILRVEELVDMSLDNSGKIAKQPAGIVKEQKF